jgi:hypothetical protein
VPVLVVKCRASDVLVHNSFLWLNVEPHPKLKLHQPTANWENHYPESDWCGLPINYQSKTNIPRLLAYHNFVSFIHEILLRQVLESWLVSKSTTGVQVAFRERYSATPNERKYHLLGIISFYILEIDVS